ncbi:MAG TPA: glutamine--fructose-6-phosphate transaminase (isomerizing) [Hyphomonadaceae bacterium]|jgi:glucosamine--fructose-6-phosphate aminotransferase (isomerizing)|nr:glutamine--fructose-6-phosphate transaminase (isomerizing) [Hyphomonadaceae bacterium]
MCGIIGILSDQPAAPRLVEALKRLEYRGYDSAGVALLEAGKLKRLRAPGKLTNLDEKVRGLPLKAGVGIGHTRWATHGQPNETNAHPHASGRVAIVHNGIIENFRELREAMEARGRKFETETDSETIAHLIDEGLSKGLTPKDAFKATLDQLRGAFAIAAIIEGEENLILGGRRGSPLVIGIGEKEMFLGSDALAVGPFTQRVIYLEEGDWCALTRTSFEIFDAAGKKVERAETHVPAAGAAAEKGNYRHFMQKEIYEQPDFAGRTISAYVEAFDLKAVLPTRPGKKTLDFTQFERIQIVACGTAFYAGFVAKYWFEQLAGIVTDVDVASEFRYREPVLGPKTLAIVVTQSGETADTKAAMEYCKAKGVMTAAVVNVPTSSIARECDAILPTLAGVEIGVASTKAFTAQLCALLATAIAAGRARGFLSREVEKEHVAAMLELPRLISEALKTEPQVQKLAIEIAKARDVLYLGRGPHYPIALEGALKLKEISYIHAEGYAAGELKHGPIALIDEHTPVIMAAPHDHLLEKSLSNLQEVAARRGKVFLVSDAAGIKQAGSAPWGTIQIPDCLRAIQPIVTTIPLQLLAYHVAVEKGTDVDQPRNLAKSVTVE